MARAYGRLVYECVRACMATLHLRPRRAATSEYHLAGTECVETSRSGRR
jgi:hypothetical protein